MRFLLGTGTTKTFMGEHVLNTVYLAHLNYARYLHSRGIYTLGKQTVYDLSIKIKL